MKFIHVKKKKQKKRIHVEKKTYSCSGKNKTI